MFAGVPIVGPGSDVDCRAVCSLVFVVVLDVEGYYLEVCGGSGWAR